MLSASNLNALDEAGVGFIVGARTTRAPGDLEARFRWSGDAFTDGQVIDTITPRRGSNTERDKSRKSEPVWDPHTHPGSWRAVWAYSKKRVARDNQTLTAQENRARAVIAGEKRPKNTRFVTVRQGDQVLDEASIARARSLVGLKGYVTNIPSHLMDAGEVVSSYHELWHVEQSFRMSKHDLPARPVFHHTRDAIEAHLTVVMASLAVARYLWRVSPASKSKIQTRPQSTCGLHRDVDHEFMCALNLLRGRNRRQRVQAYHTISARQTCIRSPLSKPYRAGAATVGGQV